MKLKRFFCALLIMTICVLFASCDYSNNDKHLDFADEYREYGNMLVLGVVNDIDLTEDGVVYLDSITDNLNIQFANLTEYDSEYILKLFLDYEEIEYFIDDEIKNGYVFQAKSDESLIIPVKLNSSIDFNNSHILTVAVLTAPNKHAKNSDLMSNSYGMVLSYELAPRDGTRSISTNKICSDPTKYLELNYQGLMLNLDFDAANNATTQFPPQNIFAKAGETITLAYRAGNYENASELMVIVLIDWKQSQINDVNSLYIRNKPGYIGYGELNITTPLQAGEYEVTAFVVDSPFSLRDFNTFHTHDTAYRFTLTVQ